MGIEVNFEGKIALITGASSGLGARFAKALAGAGAQVVLASRRTDRLKELRAEIEAEGGAAHVVSLDVTDMASIKSAIAHAETEAGPIDILVNNSGVSMTQRLVDVSGFRELLERLMQGLGLDALFLAGAPQCAAYHHYACCVRLGVETSLRLLPLSTQPLGHRRG